jgi:transposase
MAKKRPRKRRIVKLKPSERKKLKTLIDGELASARERKRAQILLLSDIGWDRSAIATATGSSTSTVGRVRRDYCESGFVAALCELPRPGATPKLSWRQQQHLVALACTDPPEGYSRWSVRLLTHEAICRGIAKQVSRETIRVFLHQHGLKPWREKNVVRAEAGRGIRRADGGSADPI